MTSPGLTLDTENGAARLKLAGAYVTAALDEAERALGSVRPQGGAVEIDLGGIEALDTGGAWLIVELMARLEREGHAPRLTGASDGQAALIETVRAAMASDLPDEDAPRGLRAWLGRVGRATVGAWRDAVSLMAFLGLTLSRVGRAILRPRRLRMAALVSQMQEVGLNAVPIVVLMSFLIGVVLAFQGASQLRQFGAEVFVVELISVSILRELGILLTAIIVAGRSGSAFTASIGSMKVREEIDAMRTLGLDPVEVLVLPRVLALLFMLPVLGFIANLAGLFGGALMSWVELGVSPGMFITRLNENTSTWHLGVSMIKAPVFAVVIGVVACWQGMQVRGSAESVGRRTTASVVQAIFLVITADALFSVFFSELGV